MCVNNWNRSNNKQILVKSECLCCEKTDGLLLLRLIFQSFDKLIACGLSALEDLQSQMRNKDSWRGIVKLNLGCVRLTDLSDRKPLQLHPHSFKL